MGFRITALFAFLLLVALHAQPLARFCAERADAHAAEGACCTEERCGCCGDEEGPCRCGCAEANQPLVPKAYFCPQGCESHQGGDLASLHSPLYLPSLDRETFIPPALLLEPEPGAPLPTPLLPEVPEPPPRTSS